MVSMWDRLMIITLLEKPASGKRVNTAVASVMGMNGPVQANNIVFKSLVPRTWNFPVSSKFGIVTRTSPSVVSTCL